MKTFNPTIIDGEFPKMDCPCVSEFEACSIIKVECPEVSLDDNDDYVYDYPDDCPAKEGVTIKL